ncbi:hypothetical protein J3Q64DRAFT_1402906 [Phycomyces blakesleeanus]|uniref:Uncharacterized protein n=2 Tax=Phycomyces blakesleeanus TaxID=4837 RepID=A0A162XSW3_PHYB8|nr:hypothetical protein PHYBLDRAFT_166317 [Phycomyces blakesleeanus NRRL 1555(-)]OAD76345.1 hypothetical protein PHYBLDRAFT_166317 [Phycomyces blakesleeanus NRRL 1555(-)]|eukprot:XP_018294385.1 hypothetical protein PHYBLDRAFT_166317 [Phycomyces blakesleeanus NRRL 1555(-)]
MSYFTNKVLEIRNRKRNGSESSANGSVASVPNSSKISVNSKENKSALYDEPSQNEGHNSQLYLEQLQQMANQPAFTNTPYMIDEEQYSSSTYSTSTPILNHTISNTQGSSNGHHHSYIPSYTPLFSTSEEKKTHQANGDVQVDSFGQWNDIMEDTSSTGDDNYDLSYSASHSGISTRQNIDQASQPGTVSTDRDFILTKVDLLEVQVSELSKAMEKLRVENLKLVKEKNSTSKDLEQQLIVLKKQLAKKQDDEQLLQTDIYSNVFFIFYFIFYCMKHCFINGQSTIMMYLEGSKSNEGEKKKSDLKA